MNKDLSRLIPLFVFLIGIVSMYLVFNTQYEVIGFIGMTLILCRHLIRKYKNNWSKR